MSDGDATDTSVEGRSTPGSTDEPGAILGSLVEEATGIDVATSDGAVTFVERGDDPDPGAWVLDLIDGDESVVGVVPRVEPSLARGLAGRVDGDIRLVLTGSAGERLTGASGAPLRSVLANHGVGASVHDGDSPVGVLLVGERAVVGLFDDKGLAAVLSSDSSAVREWAAATCQRYFAAADPV